MPLPSPSSRRHPHRLGRRWLDAPGSLTARLRGLGTVTVHKLRQGHQPLRALERQILGATHGHVREVVLHVDGVPAVWARSVVHTGSVKGAWRALRGLGNRPLAELLFTDRTVHRAPLQAMRMATHAPGAGPLRRDWQACLSRIETSERTEHERPVWLRWSVFERRRQSLLVQEVFAPWVLERVLPRSRR